MPNVVDGKIRPRSISDPLWNISTSCVYISAYLLHCYLPKNQVFDFLNGTKDIYIPSTNERMTKNSGINNCTVQSLVLASVYDREM